eukprot:TRINITY_DN4186_c0_g2_i1.p1 TRINITY_DN4186_c0_g2~~TRINITY_DN4186_c0_g2_i1.p1  ORF type:complete len:223 (-),score=43.40 TRINITY_DN4186_c0_g2_i1:145-762(-)
MAASLLAPQEEPSMNPLNYLTPDNPPVGGDPNSVKVPTHPIATTFHLLWKVAALAVYIFGSLVFSGNSALVFVFCVLFVVFDFWTTKNVSGRLMVGLRWWNDVKPDGATEWRFESLEGKALINPWESRVFWVSTFVVSVVWGIFAVKTLFSFAWDWVPLTGLATILGCTNLVGYIKCARDAQRKFKKAATGYLVNAAINQAMDRA